MSELIDKYSDACLFRTRLDLEADGITGLQIENDGLKTTYSTGLIRCYVYNPNRDTFTVVTSNSVGEAQFATYKKSKISLKVYSKETPDAVRAAIEFLELHK